jgi:hypothetical protein
MDPYDINCVLYKHREFMMPETKPSLTYILTMDLVRFIGHPCKKTLSAQEIEQVKFMTSLGIPTLYAAYENKEPGYLKTWLNAYSFTLVSTAFNPEITPSLVQKIQAMASAHLDDPTVHGSFCTEELLIPTFPEKIGNISIPRCSQTLNGLREFIDYWFLSKSNPFINIHHIAFNINPSFPSWEMSKLIQVCLMESYDPTTRKFKIKTPDNESYEATEMELLAYLEENSRESNRQITIERRALPEDQIQRILTALCDDFNRDINKGHVQERKKRIIVEFVMRLDQLHAFSDCNIRTCYILMNVLFARYGLPMSLLFDPNRFDLCSVDEVLDMVNQGVGFFEQLVEAATAQVPPERIIFKNSQREMIAPRVKIDNADAAAQIFKSMLMASKDYKPKRLNPKLQEALEAENYSLAFRMSCVVRSNDLALWMIDRHATKINFEGTTTQGKTGFELIISNTKMSAEEKEYLLTVIQQAQKLSSGTQKAETRQPQDPQITQAVAQDQPWIPPTQKKAKFPEPCNKKNTACLFGKANPQMLLAAATVVAVVVASCLNP